MFKFFKKLLYRNNYNSNDWVPYGMSPGFTIRTNTGSYIMGHMVIKTTDTDREIAYKLISWITKCCKNNNLSTQQTLDAIISNLRNNNLISEGESSYPTIESDNNFRYDL